MVCQDCALPEKKYCAEYGLPAPEHTVCWVNGQPLKKVNAGSCFC